MILINTDRKNLPSSVDSHQTVSTCVTASGKHSLRGNTVHTYAGTSIQIKHVQITKFRDNEDNIVFFTCLNCYREIRWSFEQEIDNYFLKFWLKTNFNNKKLFRNEKF